MRPITLNYLFTFQGRVTRRRYLLLGAFFLVLKFVIDSAVAAHFGHPWHIWNYVIPPPDITLFGLAGPQRRFYLVLWAIAVPFFWIGISLTVRRLRDAAMRLGWLFLFFVPGANFTLFLYLSLAPGRSLVPESDVAVPDGYSKPHVPVWLGVIIAAALGLALVFLGADIFAKYAWSLFLGVPFVTGFVASWLLNARSLHSRSETVWVCIATPVVIGIALIGFRLEGLACLVMVLPLALPFSIAGGLFAFYCIEGRTRPLTPPGLTVCVAILPLLMFAEHIIDFQPPVEPVVTTVIIHAPVAEVWKNVIAFPPLDPPKDLIFRTGIAYPIGAVIHGAGPGAVRYCRFSTGDFVEPITTWDENHLLAFSVAAQPPAMHEIGFGKVATPHVDRNYMRSQHGQFRLVALDANTTLLEGTTWYQDYFWPQIYWRSWSDAIVHRIHQRVLEHVKRISEAEALPSPAN
jgi:uncharacterized membrane protein YhaH (DUF805 family)